MKSQPMIVWWRDIPGGPIHKETVADITTAMRRYGELQSQGAYEVGRYTVQQAEEVEREEVG